MIKNYKQYNESIRDLMVGPTKEEVWKSLGYGKPFETPIEYITFLLHNIKKDNDDYNISDFFYKKKYIFSQYKDINYISVNNDIIKLIRSMFRISKNKLLDLFKNEIEKRLNITNYKIEHT